MLKNHFTRYLTLKNKKQYETITNIHHRSYHLSEHLGTIRTERRFGVPRTDCGKKHARLHRDKPEWRDAQGLSAYKNANHQLSRNRKTAQPCRATRGRGLPSHPENQNNTYRHRRRGTRGPQWTHLLHHLPHSRHLSVGCWCKEARTYISFPRYEPLQITNFFV